MVMGYDPMLQFIHEADTAEALTLALTKPKAGVYNLAGEGLISFSRSIEMAGGTPVPIPPFFTAGAIAGLRLAGIHFPKHLTEYFKYPVIISDQGFRRDFGYKPAVSTLEALRSLRGDLIS
jgi:UDP-glucose 4-epimerase